uniref:Protein COFACTOR ASSEMBLY OF COMPLEX C SUBUNIT B CCB2, chloroplastic n=1 Tax=Zea mays TaxID=4577 RepID=A0A804LME9_MAIZE
TRTRLFCNVLYAFGDATRTAHHSAATKSTILFATPCLSTPAHRRSATPTFYSPPPPLGSARAQRQRPSPAAAPSSSSAPPARTLRSSSSTSPCSASPSRSEAVGLCLAAFSATLPFLGRFLEGADAASRVPLPEGSIQVFVMSENLSAVQKEDMAWASYVLLRNTNTTSVVIAIGDLLCVRGYWNPPANTSKYSTIEWFKSQMQQLGLVDLRGALYFPNSSDSQLAKILPDGILSVLAQPILSPDPANNETKTEGVILLACNANYAYSEKDRAWIRTVADKFQRA